MNAGFVHFRRGSALLLSLWALLLLSAALLAWLKYIYAEIEVTRAANFGLDAKALAHSGVEIALHPLVTPRTPILKREISEGRGYEVTMVGEGGRLNLNWLLAGEDPAKLNILKGYFARHGLDFQQRETLVDQMLDFVDADNVRRMNGLEEAPGYVAPNRAFQSVEELALIPAAEPLLESPGWRNDLTVLSQGPIDLAHASLDVLLLIPGVSEPQAVAFVQGRDGADELPNTEDDLVFETVDAARSYLGLTSTQFESLAGLVTLNEPTYHIRSVGHVSDVKREIEAVARKVGNNPNILFWQEF